MSDAEWLTTKQLARMADGSNGASDPIKELVKAVVALEAEAQRFSTKAKATKSLAEANAMKRAALYFAQDVALTVKLLLSTGLAK